jgi:hypothetical protein
VLVDFYAEYVVQIQEHFCLSNPGSESWCNPCKLLSPILEKITADPTIKSGSGLAIDLVTVDTDDPDGFELGQIFKVCSLPFRLLSESNQQIRCLSGPCPAYCDRVPAREARRQLRWGTE